jgi:hypothetical protein
MTPGLAVALVCQGRIAWVVGYGVADQAKGQPVTSATRFQAASVSEPVTAWGVLRLVEQGRIGLDEPVAGHLRRWCPPSSPFQADGITVRRLLSHTAGLSVHGYAGQTLDRPLPPIEASLSGEAGGSFRWCRTAAAACPHDAEGGRIPEFCFAEQAAAGLVTTAAELAYHEGANRGWRAGLALLPDRRAGIVVLANSDAGSAPINAMVQQWMMLSTKP